MQGAHLHRLLHVHVSSASNAHRDAQRVGQRVCHQPLYPLRHGGTEKQRLPVGPHLPDDGSHLQRRVADVLSCPGWQKSRAGSGTQAGLQGDASCCLSLYLPCAAPLGNIPNAKHAVPQATMASLLNEPYGSSRAPSPAARSPCQTSCPPHRTRGRCSASWRKPSS